MTPRLHQTQKLNSRWITDLDVGGLIIIKLLEENRRISLEVRVGKKKIFFNWTQKTFTTKEKAGKLDYIELSYLQREGSCSQDNASGWLGEVGGELQVGGHPLSPLL